jgi:hypothetical protein
VYSLLRKGYQFDGYYSDDAVQAPLILSRLHPDLLANDPLIALLSGRYQSGLLDLVVALDPLVSIQTAYFAFFCIARVLLFVAIHRIVLTLTANTLAAGFAVFLAAGAAISYFGGVNFIETILTPRGLALPFALFGLNAYFDRRALAMTGWLTLALYLHPVTGLTVVAAIAFCGLFFPATADRKPFIVALAALAGVMLAIGAWTGRIGGEPQAWRYDAAWAQIIEQTVGPWVYLHLLPGGYIFRSLWVPALAVLALVFVGRPELKAWFVRTSLAAAAALALHALFVDLLNVQLALQMSLQRAAVVPAVVALAVVSLWLSASVRARDPLRRAFAVACFIAAVAFADPSLAILFGGGLGAAWGLRNATISSGLRAAIATVTFGVALVLGFDSIAPSFHFTPSKVGPRLERFSALGSDPDWVAMQNYLRAHSKVGDVVMPPMALSPRLVAQRPSTLTWKMQSFTHLSRPYAFEYWHWRNSVGLPFESAAAPEAIRIARGTGASWLVLDDGEKPAVPGDPPPDLRIGPFRAYRLSPGP